MIIKINPKKMQELILITFYAICVYNPNGILSVPGYITRTVFLLTGVYSLYRLFLSTNTAEKNFFKDTVWQIILVPDIILLFYGSIAALFQYNSSNIINSTFSLFVGRILIIFFIWSNIKRLGYKSIDCFFWGCALSYSYTLVNYFAQNGLINGLRQV